MLNFCQICGFQEFMHMLWLCLPPFKIAICFHVHTATSRASFTALPNREQILTPFHSAGRSFQCNFPVAVSFFNNFPDRGQPVVFLLVLCCPPQFITLIPFRRFCCDHKFRTTVLRFRSSQCGPTFHFPNIVRERSLVCYFELTLVLGCSSSVIFEVKPLITGTTSLSRNSVFVLSFSLSLCLISFFFHCSVQLRSCSISSLIALP